MWRRNRRRHGERPPRAGISEVSRALGALYRGMDPTSSSSEVMDGRFASALAAHQTGRQPHRPHAVAPLALVLMAALLLGATYAIATAMSQPQPGALGPGGVLHCSGIAELAPADAGQALADRGYRISYRDEQTTDGRFGVSRVTDVAPPGAITDIVVHGDLAIIFVSPADDVLAQRAEHDNC